MDDGISDRSGFIFHTNNFTYEEVLLLIKSLKNKFNLNCSIHNRKETLNTKKCYMIYIKADSFQNFKNLVSPYFHYSMLYKLILRK